MPSSSRADLVMRNAALRHVLASIDSASARALFALAAEAKLDIQYLGEASGPAAQLVDGLLDLGRFHASGSQVNDDDAIALAAFRYSLGRMTTITQTCSEWLADQWQSFAPEVQETIVSEIRAAIKSERAGMECDVAFWLLLIDRVQSPSAAGPG